MQQNHMKRSAYGVASVDNNSLTDRQIKKVINAYGIWIEGFAERGFEVYLISFMFKLNRPADTGCGLHMRDEIIRVYCRFLKECVRHPRLQKNIDMRPVLIACPDWPIWKRGKKASPKGILAKEGVHWSALLAVPVDRRFDGTVRAHFKIKGAVYLPKLSELSRIHLKRCRDDYQRVTGYVLKSVRLRRCTFDEILVLPHSADE